MTRFAPSSSQAKVGDSAPGQTLLECALRQKGTRRPYVNVGSRKHRVACSGTRPGRCRSTFGQFPQPVIAALNGVAAGMGLSIALSCDIRVASEQARFASIFIKRSIMPDTGATYFLPHIAPGVAAEMALTGNVYDAKWGLEKGLVTKVVPHDSLLAEARAYAETIAGNPPIGVRMTKYLIQRGMDADLQQALTNESYYNSQAAQTDDRKEAILSFLEKRDPQFKGR